MFAEPYIICKVLHMNHAKNVSGYLDELQAKGRSAFTSEEFRTAFSLSKSTAQTALFRMKAKGRIANPVHNLHLIVPPEYRSLRSLPPDQMIDLVMSHLKLPYYVALLSAAEKYGAAHQRPQKYQVMVAKKRRDIVCGRVRIQFIKRANLQKLPTSSKTVRTGTFKIASPELTALDLVGFQNQSGGLQHVLTVLIELSESLDKKKLLEAAKLCPVSWAQRLGVLLDLLGKGFLTEDLQKYIRKSARTYVPLITGQSTRKSKKDSRWRVVVNGELEADEV